jgi:hypothetical protein
MTVSINIAKDYKTLLDIDQLKAGNDLLYKWIKVFKIPDNKFTVFISDFVANPKKYADTLSESQRLQFLEEYPLMIYPKQIENTMVTQFYPMIVGIVTRLKEQDQDCIDEMMYHGCMAVRNALWKYRTHASNASLFTYIYDGAFLRMRGSRHKYRVTIAKKSENKTTNSTDLFRGLNENRGGMDSIADPKSKPIIDTLPDEVDINKIFIEADLNLEEQEMMRLYIDRDMRKKDWSKIFRQNRLMPDGKLMSRQAVDNRLMIAKYKLWLVMHKMFGMEFRDKSMPFVKRYLKVRKKSRV